MKVKEYKAPKLHPNNAVRNPSVSEMMAPGITQPIYNSSHHFTVAGPVVESFVVDWQLDAK